MNLTLTERDKKLLGLTACLAILAVFGVHLIRPALAEHEALGSEYEAALQKQQEYQAQIDARAALEDAARTTDEARVAEALAAVRRCDEAISYNVSPETCIDCLLLEVRDALYGPRRAQAEPSRTR